MKTTKKLKIEYVPTEELRPYAMNAKIHTSEQVAQIMRSIDSFGFNDPIAVWKDNEIIEGHGRLMAAQEMGLKEVPIIRLDKLTDDERKAYMLAHNQLTMNTGFDIELLASELEGIDIDMADFGFEPVDFDFEPVEGETEEPDYAALTQRSVENILQLAYAQFDGVGPYDIPPIVGTKKVPEVEEWIGFNYVLSDKNPENKGVHFFVDDYQFERVWNNPDAYIAKLRQYKAVLAPDFSPYGDMPLICQMFNHYRKHWCAAYWQHQGLPVYPTIRSSSDPRSLEWFLDGEPENSVVAYSTMWDGPSTQREYETMIERLHPSHILLYGKRPDYVKGDNVTVIETFSQKRYGGL